VVVVCFKITFRSCVGLKGLGDIKRAFRTDGFQKKNEKWDLPNTQQNCG
jgi:hypothetical protein